MELFKKISELKANNDFEGLIELVPYAKTIGIETSLVGDNIVSTLPFISSNIGNHAIPALHGGAVAGFMENAAIFHLMWTAKLQQMPKVIDFSIDYLRSGQATTSYSQCEIIRLGRRVALCNIKVWQADIDKPFALARAHFLLSSNEPFNKES
ncbi:MAG: PaaI family thioesterase [Cycloclasticus sp.]